MITSYAAAESTPSDYAGIIIAVAALVAVLLALGVVNGIRNVFYSVKGLPNAVRDKSNWTAALITFPSITVVLGLFLVWFGVDPWTAVAISAGVGLVVGIFCFM